MNKDFTLSNCLFGSAKLTRNSDLDKYKYTSYGIGFYYCGKKSLPEARVGINVIIFGVYMSSSVHIGNKGKNILIIGNEQTQRLDSTTFTIEALYPINFTQSGKRFVLSLQV